MCGDCAVTKIRILAWVPFLALSSPTALRQASSGIMRVAGIGRRLYWLAGR